MYIYIYIKYEMSFHSIIEMNSSSSALLVLLSFASKINSISSSSLFIFLFLLASMLPVSVEPPSDQLLFLLFDSLGSSSINRPKIKVNSKKKN